jgi:hypothetical protein
MRNAIVYTIIVVLALAMGGVAVITPIPTRAYLDSHVNDTRNTMGNITELAPLLFVGYTDFLGVQVFWGIVFAVMFIGLFLTQEDTTILVILGILIGGVIMGLGVIPPEFQAVANAFLIVAVSGLGYLLIMKKVR